MNVIVNTITLTEERLEEIINKACEAGARAAVERLAAQKDEAYLTTNEVCKKLGICRATLHTFMRDGRLPVHKVGAKNMFKPSEIEAATAAIKRYQKVTKVA